MNKRKLLLSTTFVAIGVAGLMSLSPLMTPDANAAMGQAETKSNFFWWPETLDLTPLRAHDVKSNPYGADFDYAKAFNALDLEAVKKDINDVLTTSQDWWPADYGNYGPFFIRMAWHSAGTYRVTDGRGGAGGGQQRFDPLNSWPDNASLDKARRLLWPLKQKYGANISWADLMVLAGTVAMENMGFKTLGFAGGRVDEWEPDIVYWGPETEWLASNRHGKDGKLSRPLGATHMGLIYVNPEGPNANHDPLSAADAIRDAFGRMAMSEEETVALIAGGHTFGKAHGAHDPKKCLGVEPGAAPIEAQGFGWHNKCGKGNAEDTITSGLEGAWTSAPAQWTHMYLDNLFSFEWEKTKSPAGHVQWTPTDESASELVPDAHVDGKFHAPIMFTTDMALKLDPSLSKIAKRFYENPEEFEDAFARAWFKLTHRDMGPRANYLGPDVPEVELIWQDPLPELDHKVIDAKDAEKLKADILNSGLSTSELIRTAWASASTYRYTDMRGGTNGARIALAPQINWDINNPDELQKVIAKLEKIRADFNGGLLRGGKEISLADTIVLAGAAALEKAAEDAGYSDVHVPFKPGRVDASQDQTDVNSFNDLKPTADAFRNYYSEASYTGPTEMLVDKADLLGLSVPETTVLLGGMRVLDTNADGSAHGVFTDQPGTLSNDFFVNLLDMGTQWKKSDKGEGIYEGFDRATGETKWTATPVDLIFGSNSELRAVAEVYAFDGSKEKFLEDFIAVWNKVMNYGHYGDQKEI